MTSNLQKFKDDIKKLKAKGELLYYTMAYDNDVLNQKARNKIEKFRIKDFGTEYQRWYTESLALIKQMIPDRTDDFIKLYRDDKRKALTASTYTMTDYLNGVQVTQGLEVLVDIKTGIYKFSQQKAILESANAKFDSTLLDIRQILQADMLDNELEESSVLLKNGYLRASGTVAGVILESHLSQVFKNHEITIRKKNPCISDYNDSLKKAEVYDTPTWRFIQHLGDIRNLCDHKKNREPKIEEVSELIEGVKKITKTIY